MLFRSKEGVSRGSTPPLSMNVSLSSLHEVQHEYHIWITCYYYYSILATPPPYFEILESIPLSPVTHRFSSIGISLQKPLTTMDKQCTNIQTSTGVLKILCLRACLVSETKQFRMHVCNVIHLSLV